MRAGDLLAGAARGAGTGLVAGAVWCGVETALNVVLGGTVPIRVATEIAALDLLLGAGAGAILGPALRGPALALALAVAYGLLRVYSPPGLGTEGLYLVVGALGAAAGVRLVRGMRGGMAVVHLLLLTTASVALGEFALEEARRRPLAAIQGVLVCGLLPLASVLIDRVVAMGVRRCGMRLALAGAVAVVAAVGWGRPLSTAPLDDPIVTAVPPEPGTPDVIVVSLDTTRADHLSTYGYTRETSPNLTTLANDALLFRYARSPASWTLPGHASLFTGMYPGRHGAHLAGVWLEGASIDGRRNVAYPLHPQAVTLAELLRDRGYRTAAFVANFSYLYRDFGLAQGFGRYDDAPALLFRLTPHAVRFVRRFAPSFCLKPTRSGSEINAEALAWLDTVPRDRPVFLFLNYMEPHHPWLAPAPYDRWSRGLPQAPRLAQRNLYTHAIRPRSEAEREFMVANYDGQIAAMDAALGELLAGLRARGRYESAMIVVTSDHGEFLGEHAQIGHIARMLYEPVLRIPLVVKFPGPARPRGESVTPVQLVDVLPTVAREAGVAVPPGVQGQPLSSVTHASIAEEEINPFLVAHYGEAYNRGIRVLYDGKYKLISTSRGRHMLFDLARDPEETNDLAAREPDRLSELRRLLEAALGTSVADASAGERVAVETN